MRLYARMSSTQYADYVDMAASITLPSGGDMPKDMCEIDPEGAHAEAQATLNAIEAEAGAAARRATRDARAARADDPAGARGSKKQRRPAPATGNTPRTQDP